MAFETCMMALKSDLSEVPEAKCIISNEKSHRVNGIKQVNK